MERKPVYRRVLLKISGEDGQVAYSRTLVEQRYRELGCQSVIIIDED